MKFIIIMLSLFVCYNAKAGSVKRERYYQEKHCKSLNGEIEYVIEKQRRVDCVTEKYAIEYDFAYKVYECVSQARHYGLIMHKKPVCALIVINKKHDKRYFDIAYENDDIKIVCIGRRGVEIKCPHA